MAIALAHDGSAGGRDHVGLEGAVRVLRDDILFHPGEPKSQLYLIEKGIVAQYRKRTGEAPEVVEFAFAGDVVGFGYAGNHVCGAQAVGETHVRCLPLTALDEILCNSKRALDRYAEAYHRKFEFRRNELTGAHRTPLSRVAAILLVLSEQNKREGQDPVLITDTVECGTVATWLAMTIDELAATLVELERLGFVQQCPSHGLRLIDLDGLHQLADKASRSSS
jgi:CRP/FNR family transcriptional regulator